jgi:pimeloyl-ACP methyl ester carboxylesterase
MQEVRTRVAGRDAVYWVTGHGPPLVFLHGWSLSARSYRQGLSALAGLGRQVLAPALPGFGGTADLPRGSFSLAGYAAWVAGFLDQTCPASGPMPVLGHSFGGGVAIRTAHDRPDLVDRLVVINSIGGAHWRLGGDTLLRVSQRPWWDWGLHLARDVRGPWGLAHLTCRAGPDVVANLLRNPSALWRIGRLAAATDLSTELSTLRDRRVPMSIVWGHGDRFLPRLALPSLREVSDADFHTVDGNHTWLLTQPDTFGDIITSILRTDHRPQPVTG